MAIRKVSTNPELRHCRKCDQFLPHACFGKSKALKDGLDTYCLQCRRALRKAFFDRDPEAYRRKQREYWNRPQNGRAVKARRWHAANPESVMLERARRRAQKYGLEFSITREDILPLPTHCPALGIPLRKGNSQRDPNAFSLDRIDNSK